MCACGRLNFFSWRRKYILCWAFFTMESMWVSHFRSWEMVVPRNLNDSTAFTELFMIVSGGRAGGFFLKGVRDDGVESGAEVHKQDPCISPWFVQMLEDVVQSHVDCIIHRPVCSVSKLQGVQQGSSNVLQVSQHEPLKWLHHHRR